jgi:DNA end-binding protein Ku
MAPRAYWKGFLRLSLVSCPIQLFPATFERDNISSHQIDRETGNRIRFQTVDEETGKEVPPENIIRGYEIARGRYIAITDSDLDSLALESTRTIEIDEFVPKSEIDELYNIRPYYIVPDGTAGQNAFVFIRNVIEQMKMVAIGRVVLASRERVIALELRGKGIVGTPLRYPYEIFDENEYFRDIPDIKPSKDTMDFAEHIVETKSGHFVPDKFEDHYETALKELIAEKSRGEKSEAPKERFAMQMANLMDTLQRGAQPERQPGDKQQSAEPKSGRIRTAGQSEMLRPISGKKIPKKAAKKPARPSGRRRKPG